MTASETPTPPSAPPAGAGAERPALRLERRSLPGLDPLALLAAVPEERPAFLWRGPGGSAAGSRRGAGWLAVGRALSIEPPGDGLAGFGRAIGATLATAFAGGANGADGGGPPLRVFFSVAFDPESRERAFGDGWPGYEPAEAWLPEILIHCGASGSAGATALLAGPPERLEALGAELDTLVACALQAGGPAAAGAGERPGEVANLAIEWAERDYRAQVVAALDTLCRRSESHPRHDDDCLTKVVLSHAVTVRPDRPLAPAAILGQLRHDHPGCFLFAVRPAPGAPVFLGASPERLARVSSAGGSGPDGEEGRRVASGALAGSAPRGGSEEEDEALGRRLLESAKDREEHEIVGDMIADALAPLCRRVARRPAPVLEKLATVQHLYTPICGELHPGRGVLDAVAVLHPTPAVGGMPRGRALEAIRELERHPRGLYAGVVGWVAPDGTGDSAVAIRSALVEPEEKDGAGTASVFAGGGIVSTSDPDVEVEETRLKLAAVLGAMERAVRAPDPADAPAEERERWGERPPA